MIAHLKGVLKEKSAGRLVVDVGGVGYEVLIPFSTYYELAEIGETVSLRIYTHVKEDALSLYGFLTSKEKVLFAHLIQVSGIGPKLGIAILSGLPADEFIQAAMDGDIAKLNSIPGVGKKTAERLVLEMKDKVADLFPELQEAQTPRAHGAVQSDLVSALVNLGYHRNAAEKAVASAMEETQGQPFEEILRQSLKRIRAK